MNTIYAFDYMNYFIVNSFGTYKHLIPSGIDNKECINFLNSVDKYS